MIQGPFKRTTIFRFKKECRELFQCLVYGVALGTGFHIAVSAVYPNYFQII